MHYLPVEFVGSPQHLPRPPRGRVAVLDIAFASGVHFERVTVPFIDQLGARLALWCDHHEHLAGWARYRGDPRFLLVPNRDAHACPELITPEVVARAGPLDGLVVHGDFDGLLTAVKILRKGQPPWPEADEDGRAVDSPGRGHSLTAHGRRVALALDEVVATFPSAARRDFLTNLLWSLADGGEPTSLPRELDSLARSAETAQQEATELARDKGREELPGVFVVRLEGRRRGRARKGILRYAEEQAKVGVVIETERSRTWVTAATFDERVDLASVVLLEGGRSDYRYCELKGTAEAVLVALRRAVENRG